MQEVLPVSSVSVLPSPRGATVRWAAPPCLAHLLLTVRPRAAAAGHLAARPGEGLVPEGEDDEDYAAGEGSAWSSAWSTVRPKREMTEAPPEATTFPPEYTELMVERRGGRGRRRSIVGGMRAEWGCRGPQQRQPRPRRRAARQPSGRRCDR